MMTAALNPVTALDAPIRLPSLPRVADTGFNVVLDTAQELDAAAQQKARAARDAANQLVATSLIQPVLAQLRSSPFQSELFSGGRGEEVFGQQLDTALAEKIAAAPGFGPSAALAARMTGVAGGKVNTLG